MLTASPLVTLQNAEPAVIARRVPSLVRATNESARRSPRVRSVVTWMREVFDRRKNPWFREDYVPPSLFGTPPAAGWTDDRAA